MGPFRTPGTCNQQSSMHNLACEVTAEFLGNPAGTVPIWVRSSRQGSPDNMPMKSDCDEGKEM